MFWMVCAACILLFPGFGLHVCLLLLFCVFSFGLLVILGGLVWHVELVFGGFGFVVRCIWL